MSSDKSDDATPRPVGVWIFTLVNALYAAACAAGWGFRLLAPPPHGLSEATIESAPYMTVLFLALFAGSWIAWAAGRAGRIAMLAALTASILVMLYDIVAMVNYLWISSGPQLATLQSWYFVTPLIAVAWLVANYWYFLGARSRDFYRGNQAPSRHR